MISNPRPYYDSEGHPVLQPSVVAVADILGFKQLVEEAHRNDTEQKELERLHTQLQAAHAGLEDPSGVKWVLKVLSDNLVVSYPYIGRKRSGIWEFSQACFNMCHFQLQLARNGLFIRGGIGVGRIHVGKEFVFGHVLNEVARADQSGNPPRVVLLPSAVEHFEGSGILHKDPSLGKVLWRNGETSFISYLFPLDALRDAKRESLMLAHKNVLEERLRLYEGKPSIYSKYLWLANYHNAFCSQSKFFDHDSYLIDI